MRIPAIQGIIDRRILANYHIDPELMARQLPAPFRPKIINNYAVGGICLIRLKAVRPRFIPFPIGLYSENAAHRIAVEWEEDGVLKEGVYIPRRDTNSHLNLWAGGSIFPGVHQYATFTTKENDPHFSVSLKSKDNQTYMHVAGEISDSLPNSSIFASLEQASDFFAAGSLGYSATHDKKRYDGLELRCHQWEMEPLSVTAIHSSYFDDQTVFPSGSIEFDCALLMRGIEHEWHQRADLCI